MKDSRYEHRCDQGDDTIIPRFYECGDMLLKYFPRACEERENVTRYIKICERKPDDCKIIYFDFEAFVQGTHRDPPHRNERLLPVTELPEREFHPYTP